LGLQNGFDQGNGVKVILDPVVKEVEGFDMNVIVGADGEHSKVAEDFGFDKKVFKAGEAIGVTANLVNHNAKEENELQEFNGAYLYKQEWFDTLKEKSGVDLENLVYYKDETHYFVMTAKKQSLFDAGVLKSECGSIVDLLSGENVNKEELVRYVRHVADYVGLPSSCQFEKTNQGTDDVQIFDFTKKHAVIEPMKVIQRTNKEPLLVFMIGDASIEPFWPLGTGAARGILGALDGVWFMWKSVGMNGNEEKLKEESLKVYHRLYSCGTDELRMDNSGFSTEPSCRYKGISSIGGMQ